MSSSSSTNHFSVAQLDCFGWNSDTAALSSGFPENLCPEKNCSEISTDLLKGGEKNEATYVSDSSVDGRNSCYKTNIWTRNKQCEKSTKRNVFQECDTMTLFEGFFLPCFSHIWKVFYDHNMHVCCPAFCHILRDETAKKSWQRRSSRLNWQEKLWHLRLLFLVDEREGKLWGKIPEYPKTLDILVICSPTAAFLTLYDSNM